MVARATLGIHAPNMRVQRTRVLLPAVARRSPLTRRPLGGLERWEANMAAFALVLATAATLSSSARASDVSDDFAVVLSQAARDSVQERFPGYLIWSVRIGASDGSQLQEITVFPSGPSPVRTEKVGDTVLHTRLTYKLVVSEDGTVATEDAHPIPDETVPQAARETFATWRTGRPTGMAVLWSASQKRNEQRRYVASIIVSAVESHCLTTDGKGVIIQESVLRSKGSD